MRDLPDEYYACYEGVPDHKLMIKNPRRKYCECNIPTPDPSSRLSVDMLGKGCSCNCKVCKLPIARSYARDELPPELQKKRDAFWADFDPDLF